jgi:hypothetical protein
MKGLFFTLITMSVTSFITLKESKILRNTWYNETSDQLFILTAQGFKLIPGSKKKLIEQNLIP